MIQVQDLSLSYGKRILFKDVNIKFSPGNCYGLIGANGAGKSTFLKILEGKVEQSHGEVFFGTKERMAVLQQDQFAYDDNTVIETVIMGHKQLYDVLHERDLIYQKEDFSDADGHRAAELEELVDELNGYEAESDAAILLDGLGIGSDLHDKKLKELEGGQKVRVLLSQALFGDPGILLLDEPTNNLDIESITWLENFLLNFKNTVIVVSHDRHFMNKVCTHVADIDYGKITIYPGNYDFWAEASQLMAKQKKDENRKKEDKAKELKSFIERFSSNASKAKQATSRKKLLEKMSIEDMPASSRKFPYIAFNAERECGKMILSIEKLNKSIEGETLITDFNLVLNKGDRIALVGQNNLAKTVLFQMLMGEMEPDSGEFKWGETITKSYFPKENGKYFENKVKLLDWLKQYSPNNDETFVRGFLGRMLFTGEESSKTVDVLSGGEKARCMLSRMMLAGTNVIILDEPTNHLDLESITALNNGLMKFSEIILFSSHDHQFINSIANRIIEITPNGFIDRRMSFDDYIHNEDVKSLRDDLYKGHERLNL